MKTWIKYALFTIVLGIPALIAGNGIWHPTPELNPSPAQLPFFIFLSVVEALLFGFGVGYLFMNWMSAKEKSKKMKSSLPMWAHIALSWGLISWWAHDNFHKSNGLKIHGLLMIEYSFHLTLIVAILIISGYVYNTASKV